MYAVIASGGRQLRVEPKAIVEVDLLSVSQGDRFETDQVLLVGRDEEVRIGKPFVPGVKVTGTVLNEKKGEKIRIFTYRPKKDSRRTKGHRARLTRVRIEQIEG